MNSVGGAQAGVDDLADILGLIREDLDRVDGVLEEVLRPPTAQIRPLVEHVKRFRGKMLRPALVMLAGRCFGEIGAAHHQLGAIVEMIHVATLVHDDVLDSAARRRKLETTNVKWGNEAAVLLGDYLFATAFALSANLENRLASRYLSWVTGIVCQGEIAQIEETGNLDLAEEVYLDLIEKKTAYLFSGSARVGAEYMGAPEVAAAALASYGMKLGTAFQIVDDCLDLDGDELTVGKTLGTDAGQGKVTLPVIQFLRTASASDASRLKTLLGEDPGRTRDEIRTMLTGSGALAYARERAEAYAGEALSHLDVVPESPARDSLGRLARYSLRRNR